MPSRLSSRPASKVKVGHAIAEGHPPCGCPVDSVYCPHFEDLKMPDESVDPNRPMTPFPWRFPPVLRPGRP